MTHSDGGEDRSEVDVMIDVAQAAVELIGCPEPRIDGGQLAAGGPDRDGALERPPAADLTDAALGGYGCGRDQVIDTVSGEYRLARLWARAAMPGVDEAPRAPGGPIRLLSHSPNGLE